MNTKKIITGLAVILLASVGFSQEESEDANGIRRHHRPPSLSEEQKNCLEAEVGVPGEGERPTREAMRTAFEKCGIKRGARNQNSESTSQSQGVQ